MSQAETTVNRLDVIAVGPHPDDLEITCGGTLALLAKQGYKVGILDLTSGEPTPRGSLEISRAKPKPHGRYWAYRSAKTSACPTAK